MYGGKSEETMADSEGEKRYTNSAQISMTSESRYQDIRPVSGGASGALFYASDSKTNSRVIIKRLVVESITYRQEARLLRQLDHENVVVFHGTIHHQHSGTDRCQSLYAVQEMLDTDLQMLILSGQLTSGHCKLFTYQLMRGLKYIHSADIYHGNLRPNVIQINSSSLMLKIGDFSLSGKAKSADAVGSCWYCSPELIMSSENCTKATDLWSAGCIVAEMATGQPFFRGNGKLEQLLKYIDCVHLNDDDWRQVLHVMPNKMLKNHPFRPRRPLRLQLAGQDHDMVQLVDHLLTFNHERRITAGEALAQPYLEEYYCPEDEPVAQLPFQPIDDKANDDEAGLRLLLASLCSSLQVDLVKSQDGAIQGHPSVLTQSQSSPLIHGQTSSLTQGHTPHLTQDEIPLLTQAQGQPLQPTRQLDSMFNRMAVDVEVNQHDSQNQSRIDRNEVALKNLRNNQERIGDDRTPSPNIIDLLNQSFESDPGSSFVALSIKGPDGKVHEADSESEKETAEISDEKLREDLEVGNITTEVLRRLGTESVPALLETVRRPETFPTSLYEKEGVSIASSSQSTLVTRRECQKLMKADLPIETLNETEPGARNFGVTSDFNNLGCLKHGSNHKNCATSPPKAGLVHSPIVLVNIPEDSNKYSGDEFDEKLKSQSESVQLSRKLILDKIESEKKSQQQRMSCMSGDLTSEEFDELYRLPTEHLRKDKSRNERVRHRHSHEWPRCGRHPDDSSDRYGYYKDDRLHSEGACGGHDYCDDMQASFSRSSIEFDLDPYLPEVVIERSQTLSLDEPELASTDLRFVRPAGTGVTTNRDASSSPESPASPRTIQTGARPKKSPKKHRAV